ncbi:MAG: RidA family protein [Fidelibacterota bacterium]
MEKKVIHTNNAPAAIGPYSQGIECGGFIFTAGQIPIDPDTTKLIDGNFQSQVRRVLENIKGILSEGGSDLSRVVKMTVFVTDLNNFSQLNAVFSEFFGNTNPPARSAVEVSALPLGSEVEIECIAAVDE